MRYGVMMDESALLSWMITIVSNPCIGMNCMRKTSNLVR